MTQTQFAIRTTQADTSNSVQIKQRILELPAPSASGQSQPIHNGRVHWYCHFYLQCTQYYFRNFTL